ncbi:hypothetical protein VN1183_13210 [Helicobacter pylori]|nr:hypothetical protein VN1183_13210 [Helicobacter pylori]
MDFRILNTKYLLFKHYASKISLCEKLRETDLLSQLKVRASGHFNEKVY